MPRLKKDEKPKVGAKKTDGVAFHNRSLSGFNNNLDTLLKNHASLGFIIDILPDFIHVKDINSRVVIVNVATANLLGLNSPKEAAGKTDFDFYPPEKAEEYYQIEQEIIRSGRGKINQEHPIVLNGWKAEDTMWVSSTKVPLRNDKGEIIGLVGVVRNITERKHLEFALRNARAQLEQKVKERTADLREANKSLKKEIVERERAQELLSKERNLLRTLIDNLPDLIFVKDTDARFVVSNIAHAGILGELKPSRTVGKTDFDYFTKDMAEQFWMNDREVIESGKHLINHEEQVIDQTSKSLKIFSTTKAPLKDVLGNIIGLVGIARDVTEKKRIEQELQTFWQNMSRAEQLASLGMLGASLAHELNQPLTVIHLFIEQSIRQLSKIACPPNVLKKLNQSLIQIANAMSITARYRSLSRQKTRKITSKIDVNAVAERIIMAMTDIAQKANFRLIKKNLDKLPLIPANVSDIEQLFFILVQNAIQAADGKRGRHLIIDGTFKNKQIHLRFKDNCCGIPHDNLNKIFEPFFTTKPPDQGTGLGLAILKRIVIEYGGTIKVESEVGKGTCFNLTLPTDMDWAH